MPPSGKCILSLSHSHRLFNIFPSPPFFSFNKSLFLRCAFKCGSDKLVIFQQFLFLLITSSSSSFHSLPPLPLYNHLITIIVNYFSSPWSLFPLFLDPSFLYFMQSRGSCSFLPTRPPAPGVDTCRGLAKLDSLASWPWPWVQSCHLAKAELLRDLSDI